MNEVVEKIIIEEKKAAVFRILNRGKLTNEEIAEDLDLPLSVIEEIAENWKMQIKKTERL